MTSWQVGGSADFYAEPTDETELESAIRFGVESRLPITFLGGGTNVLVSDRGVRGLLIALRKFSGLQTSEVDGRFQIEAKAGASKSELLFPINRVLPEASGWSRLRVSPNKFPV